jgi:Raf kinase inhibitor-like YbhB/YbcL family protein
MTLPQQPKETIAMKMSVLVLSLLLPVAAFAGGFTATSPDLDAQKPIANKYVYKGFGCEGENVSPAVVWQGAPEGTKSFAVAVHDPDAPTGGAGWWHWLVINIPADMHGLQQGSGDPAAKKMPKAVMQARTDFGKPGWGGPCPPKGDKPHRYIFTVYALKVEKLDAPEDATGALVGYMINANSIAKASFTARYGRK